MCIRDRSEGLLGVITEVTVKILKSPEIVKAALIGFPTIEDAGNCVAEIIAEGCIPAGMEIMDKALTKATNDYSKAGYPTDAEAMMIVELDGTEKEVNELIEDFLKMIKDNPDLESNLISEDEKTKLMSLSGVKKYPMRVKCATLPWHTLISAMTNKPGEVNTEKED